MLQLMINTHKCIGYATFEETGELARELCSACQSSEQARLLRQLSAAVRAPAFYKRLLGDF